MALVQLPANPTSRQAVLPLPELGCDRIRNPIRNLLFLLSRAEGGERLHRGEVGDQDLRETAERRVHLQPEQD